MYDEKINNGYFKKLTEGETDNFLKDIKKKVFESYKDKLNCAFNKRKHGLYLTKDKNLHIEKYDILKEKTQGLEETQTKITNDINTNQIQIDISINETPLNLKIKNLIDVIENHILNISIIDKYVYSFLLKIYVYPLKSIED